MCIQMKNNAVESALHDCLYEEQPGLAVGPLGGFLFCQIFYR